MQSSQLWSWKTLGRSLYALEAVRGALLDACDDLDRRADLMAILPVPLTQLRCPSCWTHRAPSARAGFIACPSCGHGMFLAPIQRPYACSQCHAVMDGPPRTSWHRAIDAEGREGRRCTGTILPRPYLPQDVLVDDRGAIAIMTQSGFLLLDEHTDIAILRAALSPGQNREPKGKTDG